MKKKKEKKKREKYRREFADARGSFGVLIDAFWRKTFGARRDEEKGEDEKKKRGCVSFNATEPRLVSGRKRLPFGDLCASGRYVDTLRQLTTLPIASHARHSE